MKNIIIDLIICLIIVTLCSGCILGNSKNGIIIIEDSQLNPSKDTFRLNMQKNDVLEMIKNKKIKIIREDNHGTEGSSIYCEDIRFQFDQNNKVIEIFIYDNKAYKTSKGLIIGDSVEKLLKLYGNSSSIHDEMDATVYQYKFESNYLSIILENKLVSGWGIHKKSNY